MTIFERNGAPIDDILYCPHLRYGDVPEYSIDCDCRKPAPGMIEKACFRHNINPFLSFVIGDKVSDMELALVTSSKGVLVRTGYGRKSEEKLKASNYIETYKIAGNLAEAVDLIITDEEHGK
jgi:D-glycero-D-manno-heptose 1,7-bisphosphate phosphatase